MSQTSAVADSESHHTEDRGLRHRSHQGTRSTQARQLRAQSLDQGAARDIHPSFVQQPCQKRSWTSVTSRWMVVLKLASKTIVATGLSVALIAVALLYSQWQHVSGPYANLHAFALSQTSNEDLRGISDLKADELNLFAQATCVQGMTAEEVRAALSIQLNEVPKEISDMVVRRAVIEGMSTTESIQNSKVGVSENGKAFSYLAFWSTSYNSASNAFSRYSTCVTVAGVTILVGDEQVGVETSTRKRQIGTRPCECGRFICDDCPVFEDVKTKTPIFKRNKLTLKNQMDLQRWMGRQAVDRARSLVDTRAELRQKVLGAAVSKGLSSIGWTAPNEDTVPGSDGGGYEGSDRDL